MTQPIIHLVKAYQHATDQDTRDQLAGSIIEILRPQLGRFAPKLYSPGDFEDFEMEVLSAVLAGLGTFRGNSDGEFYTVFNSVGWGKCVDRNRKEDRRRKLIQPLSTDDTQEILDQFAEIDPPSHDLKMDLDWALNSLDELHPECRELLWNNILACKKKVEIAKILGLHAVTIRRKIEKCLDKLAEFLGPQYE